MSESPSVAPPPRRWPNAALLALFIAVGFGLRLFAARTFFPFIDEPASVMAAHMVAEKGWPMYPSGVLYLQGATLSLLMLPFVALGHAEMADLHAMRTISVVAGTLSIGGAWLLGRRLFGPTGALWLAFFLAIDPGSIQYSAITRPYALVQLATLATLWVWFKITEEDRQPTVGGIVALAAVFTVGVFTHIAIALILPGLLLFTVAQHGPRLATTHRRFTAALLSLGIGPAIFLGINRAFKVTSNGKESEMSFVGNHLVSLDALKDASLSGWTNLWRGTGLSDFLPPLVAAATGICLVYALRGVKESRAVGTLITVFWSAHLLVGTFTIDPQWRYTLHLHVLELVFTIGAALWLWRDSEGDVAPRRIRRIIAGFTVGLMVIGLVVGDGYRLSHPRVDTADYGPALAYVRGRQTPGEKVLVAMPPIAWLTFKDRSDLVFAAGPRGGVRATRYTRKMGDQTIDYWAGIPAITSTTELCQLIRDNPNLWIVVDQTRLNSESAYLGPFAQVLRGASRIVWNQPGGVVVSRVAAPENWTANATRVCLPVAGSALDPDAAPTTKPEPGDGLGDGP